MQSQGPKSKVQSPKSKGEVSNDGAGSPFRPFALSPFRLFVHKRLAKRIRRAYKAVSRSVRYWLGAQLLRVLLAVLPLFPLTFLERVARMIGNLAWHVMRRNRALALGNLRLALPEQSEGERLLVSKKVARSLIVNAFQVAWMAGHRERMRELIEIDGLEHVRSALGRGHGVILLGAHFGNFILQCLRLGLEDFAFSTIVNMPESRSISDILTRGANELGLNIIPRARAWSATRDTLNRLKNNEVVCVITDEEARKGGVFVDFFGYQVPTPRGPALLAARSGAEVLPAFIYRDFGARHRIVVESPVDIPRDDTAEAVEKGTAIVTKIIENVVRKYPEEWAWITHRWRKRLDKSGFGPQSK